LPEGARQIEIPELERERNALPLVRGRGCLVSTARYPDFVRNLVRQLKCLFPSMGSERIAQVLARTGLVLGATTIRRMIREHGGSPEDWCVPASVVDSLALR
jgi:hypothetical protein